MTAESDHLWRVYLVTYVCPFFLTCPFVSVPLCHLSFPFFYYCQCEWQINSQMLNLVIRLPDYLMFPECLDRHADSNNS